MPLRKQFITDEAFQAALRDWFAGQALIGFIACQSHPQSSGPFDLDPSQVARSCFLFADSMLTARHPTTKD